MDNQKGLMTSGNVYKCIALFAIPLVLGNFFQLMYNTIDSVVVGNYVGSSALAAVGASTPIINVLIAFFQGLATGAGVVVSRYYGARKVEQERKSIHTFLLFSILFGLVLSILGYFLTPYILQWISTPQDYFIEAQSYLCIYFIGAIFVTVYNAGTGILQAVGDSKNPLYFLIATSILNIFLDLLFVRSFNLGIAGAAWATVISEALSTFLVLFVLFKTKNEYRCKLSELIIDFNLLKEIIGIGIPSGVQGTIVSVSNLVVLGYINQFGTAQVAGYSCSNKIDNFMSLPLKSLMLAITTYCGQNLGAKKFDRVRQGVRAALIMSLVISIVCGTFVFIFSNNFMQIFTSDALVIESGTIINRIMCPFYVVLCFYQIYSGALRASGRSNVPMITAITSFVFLRQLYLAIAVPRATSVSVIGWCYSLTWVVCAMLTSIYYFGSHWLQKEEQKYSH